MCSECNTTNIIKHLHLTIVLGLAQPRSQLQLKSYTADMRQIVEKERGICTPQPDGGVPERHVSFRPTIPADKVKDNDYRQ